tara:strand:+ start:1211 stop:1399 length:189 start_codon:yes stop_codon:yes gene_type:complete
MTQQHSVLIYTHRDPETGEWIKREHKTPIGGDTSINWKPSGITEKQKEEGLTQDKFDELMDI